jgi:hypothetical protein
MEENLMALAPNATFGRYLKLLRMTREVTVETLSERIGFPTLFLIEMEEGRRPIPAEVFTNYPLSIGVPIRVLMQEYLNAQLATLCNDVGIAVERCELKIAIAH